MIDRNALMAAAAAGVEYSLVFRNNSSNPGNACVFQEDPEIGVENVLSLAWFSKFANPTTQVIFKWQINYDFVWAETGQLVPGVLFIASQTWRGDLSTQNKVTLTHDISYTFENLRAGTPQGSMYIVEDSTVPLKQASVGIGMSGFGTFVVQAQSNMNLTFTPHPSYWIAFGNYTQGQVLNITTINNPAQIEFPPGVTSMTAVLNLDNSWTVTPTSSANAEFVRMRAKHPELNWGDRPEQLLPGRQKQYSDE